LASETISFTFLASELINALTGLLSLSAAGADGVAATTIAGSITSSAFIPDVGRVSVIGGGEVIALDGFMIEGGVNAVGGGVTVVGGGLVAAVGIGVTALGGIMYVGVTAVRGGVKAVGGRVRAVRGGVI